MGYEKYIAIEIGGTNLRYSVIDENLNIIYFNKVETKYFSEAKDKALYLKNKVIDPLISEHKIKALTFALASLMDKERKVIFSSPMIKGFDNLPLPKMLEKYYKLPVIMEKDVNTLLLYDMKKNNIGEKGIVAGMYLGTGLGNAIAIDGKIYIGHNGASSEIGHIPLWEFDKKCGCGKNGCLELIASGKNLEKIAKNLGCKSVSDVFTEHKNHIEIKNFVKVLALAAATEAGILDPIALVLGGGVILMKDFPRKYLEKEIKKNLRPPNPRENINFIYSDGCDYAGVIGATINAKNVLL